MSNQETLPDVMPTVPEIEDAAKIYEDVRDRRMALTKEEKEAKHRLIEAMDYAGLNYYRTAEGAECKLKLDLKKDVKVSRGKGDKEEEE